MLNNLKRKIMAFGDIFKDSNDINEKSIVGFASFAVMTIFAIVDLVTGYFGRDLVINEFIYDSFLIVTLGSFGIAEVGQMFNRRRESTNSRSGAEKEEEV
tara:strand:- start:1350 stop:1649 length:300 start_codon:yes stop_codon:yes gene_type:complete